ncbi:stAR-related lipid transfer protein 7, mitochondrial [Microplitis mediator]|uniref:stAR-related lipid transfer protein 7, mitochondrial n=1 Tax=Microplitis mediator TaxID=375433 RepID=UPI0025559F5D|nr:stAR-related lipid transfer protein 7, mitochondrial [Microplitis mediator]
MYTSNLSKLIHLLNYKLPHKSACSILVPKNCRFLNNNRNSINKYRDYTHKLSVWFKEQSIVIARLCHRQFEYIAAQRVKRNLKLYHLYPYFWDGLLFKKLFKLWRKCLTRNGKEILISAVGVTMFNWDQERITDNELYSYADEIKVIHKLRNTTVVCENCNLRLIIDKKQPNVSYCTCNNSKSSINKSDDNEWEPFIERQDMLIWRKEEPNSGGMYAYKVFGTFSDVTAEEFLQVQVDVDYRKVWDPTARQLEIIDTDPKSLSAKDHRTDVIYWEMIWPRLFSNRDYVYQRRWALDKEKNIVVIVSRVTDHPDAPNRPDTYRVTSYWSYMVIKPIKSFTEPGIEFGLTYFDDPGVNIPSAVTAWVALSGLPDFLCRMRQAAKDYKSYISAKQQEDLLSASIFVDKDEEVIEADDDNSNEDSKVFMNLHSSDSDTESNIINVDDKLNQVNSNDAIDTIISNSTSENINNNNSESVNADKNEESLLKVSDKDLEQNEKETGYLRYIFLTKLFA